MVLLSDGENTAKPDPLAVAELAAVAGVNIYPIGLGSAEGTVIEIDGFSVATALDEELLNEIARTPTGSTSRPRSHELTEVYDRSTCVRP